MVKKLRSTGCMQDTQLNKTRKYVTLNFNKNLNNVKKVCTKMVMNITASRWDLQLRMKSKSWWKPVITHIQKVLYLSEKKRVKSKNTKLCCFHTSSQYQALYHRLKILTYIWVRACAIATPSLISSRVSCGASKSNVCN